MGEYIYTVKKMKKKQEQEQEQELKMAFLASTILPL
jgi:hypothetical protein